MNKNILEKQISNSMPDIEKVKAIQDYIVLNTKYLQTKNCYDPYGVIVNGEGVCQGYAKSMQLLLNKIGIDINNKGFMTDSLESIKKYINKYSNQKSR